MDDWLTYEDGEEKTETKIVGRLDGLLEQSGDPKTVSKSYVPEGFETVEAYLTSMREEHAADLEADHDNREEMVDDKNFAAGNQWDPIVLEHRKGLPCLVINSVPQFTAQVVGDWRDGRNAIKVLPSEDGDVNVASVRGDLIRAIEQKSRASRVYDSAFESTIQCGDGAFRISVEYAREDVFDQEIYIRPIEDALSVVWDRLSVDPTGRDATRCFVDDLLPRKEFDKRWPETDPSELTPKEDSYLRSEKWCDDNSVRVTEHWRMVERKKLLALFQDGKTLALTAKNYEQAIKEHGYPTKTRVAQCPYAQMHLVTGWKILAGPFEYKLNRLPIIRISGRVVNIEGNRIRYGMVRFMKDAVRLRNFWRSVAAEQLGYAPKAQWFATESAVEGREDDFRKAHLSRDPLLIGNDEAEYGKTLIRIEPPQIQAAMLNEAAVNTQDMKDVTGIHDASLGIKSNETSGKAIYARQREGDIANLTYHDNGNAAILEGGDVINQLLPQIYDGTRIVRIIGEDQTPKFVALNDPYNPQAVDISVGNYDVTLSTGASYTTRRVEAATAMMEAVQVWPDMMAVAGDLVAKAQDWPGAEELAKRLKKTIPPQLLEPDEQQEGAQQQGGMPPEAMQQMADEFQKMQEQLGKVEQENALLKIKNAEILAQKDIDQYKAETDRIKALSDHEVDNTKMHMDAIGKLLDHEGAAEDREVKKETEANKAKAKPKTPSK